ncbi:MFS transporter [Rodentibacter myodis]|uniref:MFS transporter n=1 Tax=Rodentibacter myodis TaxID=1907939 RepID=A0A1V3JMJ8_9PAST|nr:MFS transporter [Rodentibacter myodis]OOF58030.1 MFS transporter [Rodentibacter myodis]
MKENRWLKRIGYGFGDFGCNLVFGTMASYLMFFYTDVFGIEAAIVGTMLLSTRLIDAATDVIMGLIVDRTKTRWGSGRPYFVIGAIPFALFTALTFYVPDFGQTGKIIWAYATYTMLSTAYTVVNIPLNTIVPRLTSDIHERNILVSGRMVCALLGTAVVMSITQPLVEFFGQGDYEKGYFWTMSLYGVLAMFIFFFTFSQTEEVVPPTVERSAGSSVWDDFRGLTSQTWILVLVNFLYFGLYVVRNTSVIYYFTYNLQQTDWLVFVGFFGILSGLPILFVLPKLQKMFPQRTLIIACAALYILGDLVAYVGKDSATMVIISLAITGLGMYGIFGVTFAIQPDVIDYSEYEKNRSIPGMIASLQGFFVKFGMGVAGALIGWILKSGGYLPNVEQTDSALFSIEVCFIWIPLIICVAVIVLMSFYRLDAIRGKMTDVLELRRKQMAYAAQN